MVRKDEEAYKDVLEKIEGWIGEEAKNITELCVENIETYMDLLTMANHDEKKVKTIEGLLETYAEGFLETVDYYNLWQDDYLSFFVLLYGVAIDSGLDERFSEVHFETKWIDPETKAILEFYPPSGNIIDLAVEMYGHELNQGRINPKKDYTVKIIDPPSNFIGPQLGTRTVHLEINL